MKHDALCGTLVAAVAVRPRAPARRAAGAGRAAAAGRAADRHAPAAPIDFTGTWASVVTEDWQWRFVTPIVGDYTGVPLNAVGDKLARAWNPDADVKAGEQCKGFGAAGDQPPADPHADLVADDNTMKLDWDLGTQSRAGPLRQERGRRASARCRATRSASGLICRRRRRGGGGGGAGGAGAPPPRPRRGRGRLRGAAGRRHAPARRPAAAVAAAAPAPRAGGLKIVTTNLRAQYLRQNGVPVSEKAVVTDYLDIVPAPDGSQWLVRQDDGRRSRPT